jgi:outer membrane protein OmpA-like peptidoglycan-associated protein
VKRVPVTHPSQDAKYIGTVYFASNSAVISTSGKHELEVIAKKSKAFRASQVFSIGFADKTPGSDNNALSKSRAAAVIDFMRMLAPEPHYVLRWYGSSNPVSKGNSASELALNRRVEIWIR